MMKKGNMLFAAIFMLAFPLFACRAQGEHENGEAMFQKAWAKARENWQKDWEDETELWEREWSAVIRGGMGSQVREEASICNERWKVQWVEEGRDWEGKFHSIHKDARFAYSQAASREMDSTMAIAWRARISTFPRTLDDLIYDWNGQRDLFDDAREDLQRSVSECLRGMYESERVAEYESVRLNCQMVRRKWEAEWKKEIKDWEVMEGNRADVELSRWRAAQDAEKEVWDVEWDAVCRKGIDDDLRGAMIARATLLDKWERRKSDWDVVRKELSNMRMELHKTESELHKTESDLSNANLEKMEMEGKARKLENELDRMFVEFMMLEFSNTKNSGQKAKIRELIDDYTRERQAFK